MKITVTGTRFNINQYDDESVKAITLVEGSVVVQAGVEGKSWTLKPGQQVQVDGEGAVKVRNDVNTEEILAWMQGFSFHDTDIQAVMRQIARWYDVEVIIDEKLRQRPLHINGQLSRYSRVEQVLDMLAATGSLRFSIEGRTITVQPAEKENK